MLVLTTRRVASVAAFALLLTLGAPLAANAETTLPEVVDARLALDDVALDLDGDDVASDALDGPLGTGDAPGAQRPFAPEAEAPTAGTDDGPAVTRTEPVRAPIAFTSLWAELPDDVDRIAVRTSVDGLDWTAWTVLDATDGLDDPDPGTAEAAQAARPGTVSELLQTDEARFVQVEAVGDVSDGVVLRFADTAGLNESVIAWLVRLLTPRGTPTEASTVPGWINSRAQWGAAPFKGTPSVARNGVQQVVLHHTAGQNNLDNPAARGTGCVTSQVISTIRNVQHYHQVGLGWSDIGYNVVVDPCGGVWEGRAGGLDRAVVGAHASGANTGSTGVSVLGNFTQIQPNEQILAALDKVVGWKAGIHGIDATGQVTRTINGTTKVYATVVGHQNVGQTACPGAIMNHLGRIRTNGSALAPQWPRVPDGLGATPFSDISGDTHEVAITLLAGRGIVSGFSDGTYRPRAEITRAEVASLLARSLGVANGPPAGFDDVPSGSAHAGAINALVDLGVLNGFADGTFRPTEPLRRDHMAVILARALELEPAPAHATVFSDVSGYLGEIGAIAEIGVTQGFTDGTYRPTSSVTRGQMATFLVNAMNTPVGAEAMGGPIS